jgi:hypothetical protein
LCKGRHVTVLQLPVTSPVMENEAQKHGSLVAVGLVFLTIVSHDADVHVSV